MYLSFAAGSIGLWICMTQGIYNKTQSKEDLKWISAGPKHACSIWHCPGLSSLKGIHIGFGDF